MNSQGYNELDEHSYNVHLLNLKFYIYNFQYMLRVLQILQYIV